MGEFAREAAAGFVSPRPVPPGEFRLATGAIMRTAAPAPGDDQRSIVVRRLSDTAGRRENLRCRRGFIRASNVALTPRRSPAPTVRPRPSVLPTRRRVTQRPRSNREQDMRWLHELYPDFSGMRVLVMVARGDVILVRLAASRRTRGSQRRRARGCDPATRRVRPGDDRGAGALCRELRLAGPFAGTVALVRADRLHERGADDCVASPCRDDELKARARGHGRPTRRRLGRARPTR